MKRFRDLRENVLDVPTHSPETLAKKHGVSVSHIHAELKKGIGVEHEHTSDSKIAREIALDHLGEKPDYYSKLDKAGLEEAARARKPHQEIEFEPHRRDEIERGPGVEAVLKSHGFRKSTMSAGGDQHYQHPEGHQATEVIDMNGQWHHKSPGQRHSWKGYGGDSLNRHLTHIIPKGLKEGLSHKVPVYHADRKTLVGHVSSGATSIGAAKLAKKKSAIFSRVNGEYSWVASSDLKESAEMTERERISHGERMKPKAPAPIDRAQKIKQELSKHDNTNDSIRKNLAQGGVDSMAHKTIHHGTASAQLKLKEGSDLPFHKYTNDELDAAIKHHADSATELRRFDRKSHAAYQHIQHAHAAREILKSRKRNLTESVESYNVAFNEDGANKDQWGFTPTHGNTQHHQLHHYGWKRGPAQLYTHPKHKGHYIAIGDDTGKFTHTHGATTFHPLSYDLTSHLKKFHDMTKPKKLNEDAGEYKVGDKVIPKIGPHKGTVHTVIHVHPTGHLNIKPDVHVRSNRYHLGAAKADPKDVTRHLGEGFKSYLGYPNAENSHAEGTSFHQAIDHAHEHGNRVVYGTNSRKWHSVTPLDRDWHTALDPGEAKRHGEAKSLLHSTAARRVEESTLLAGREEKPLHPNDATKQKVKAAKAWGPTGSWGTKGMDFHFPQSKLKGVNSKTVQEAFQAAKDKKNGKQDNLPQSQEGANEPGKEKIAAAEPQPQALGGDAPKTQDGGQPGAQQKKDNAPKPEASKNAKKLVPKGGEQFQPDPFVTPLTTMPDTAAPKSGSQGVR